MLGSQVYNSQKLGRNWTHKSIGKVHNFGADKEPWPWRARWGNQNQWSPVFNCPYGIPGERLWVRETWCKRADFSISGMYAYRAGPSPMDVKHELCKWKPSIHMPRAASRITLEVVSVRVERLQQISSADAQNEGVDLTEIGQMTVIPDSMAHVLPAGGIKAKSYRAGFAVAWDKLNAKRGFAWETNPWAWVVEFKTL